MRGKICKILNKVALESKFSRDELKDEWKSTPRNLKPKLRKKYESILLNKSEQEEDV